MTLEIKNLALGYKDGRVLAEGLSISAAAGDMIALLGRNGVGKSTLLRVLTGVRPPLAGEVLLDGSSLLRMSPEKRARLIAFVTTESFTVAHLTVREVVAMGRAPYTGWFGVLSPEDKLRVDEALEMVGMADFRDKLLERLSDGERQRVMIARALAQDTPLIVLDEPTAFLDLPNRYQIALLLRRLAHSMEKTVIFSTHDLSTASRLCDSLWVMSPAGIADGAPEDLALSGALDVIFEHTPLSVTDGEVKLSLPVRGTVGLRQVAAQLPLLRRAVERAGYGWQELPAEDTAGDFAAVIERDETGFLKVVFPDAEAAVPDFYTLARVLSARE